MLIKTHQHSTDKWHTNKYSNTIAMWKPHVRRNTVICQCLGQDILSVFKHRHIKLLPLIWSFNYQSVRFPCLCTFVISFLYLRSLHSNICWPFSSWHQLPFLGKILPTSNKLPKITILYRHRMNKRLSFYILILHVEYLCCPVSITKVSLPIFFICAWN